MNLNSLPDFKKMKKLALIFILMTGFISACEKIYKDSPDCLRGKIRSFSKHPTCEKGASVKEYSFQGGIVYVFGEGNCGADLGAAVYSASCEQLGYLGGFTGNSKINNVVFADSAIYIKTIWEN